MEHKEHSHNKKPIADGSQEQIVELNSVGYLGNNGDYDSCLTKDESPFGFPVFYKKE